MDMIQHSPAGLCLCRAGIEGEFYCPCQAIAGSGGGEEMGWGCSGEGEEWEREWEVGVGPAVMLDPNDICWIASQTDKSRPTLSLEVHLNQWFPNGGLEPTSRLPLNFW